MPPIALALLTLLPGVDYLTEVKPLMATRCVACHGALQQKGGLRLDTVARMRIGGDSGPAIVAGKPSESPLWQRVAGHGAGRRMPPKGEGEDVNPTEQMRLSEWIAAGAPAPSKETEDPDPRDHWAFRKPKRATPAEATANPIDAWIAKRWKEQGLVPRPQADRLTLLRRLYLDLTGLPPSMADIERFLADNAPDATSREVEKLLASPAHAERWARHFMDIWRYSDWWGLGAEVRNSQKNIWHWRDWIIESVEKNVPYDEMVRQMLAADELYPSDASKLRATGFLARQYFLFNRTTWMDETVEHTSKAFLGLTANCAKCHDHKYDPIRADDYYRLRAVFEPYQVRYDVPSGTTDPMAGFPRVFDCNLNAVTHKHIRGDESRPDTRRAMDAGPPVFLNFAKVEGKPVALPAEAHAPETRADVLEAYLKEAEVALVAARKVASEAEAQVAQSRKQPSATSSEAAKPLLVESFDNLDSARWKPMGAGMWKPLGQALAQTAKIDGRAWLRLANPIPTDFEAVLRFRITGGEPYRSVGISFDAAEGRDTMVYMSANTGEPKLQIAWQRNGQYVYPNETKQQRAVPLNTPIELKIRVAGKSVEALVDGKPGARATLPDRQAGALELVTFTATAEFDHFEIRPLPVGYSPAGKSSGRMTVAQAEANQKWAHAEVAAREAEPATLQARFQARLQEVKGTAAQAQSAAREAARLESLLAVIKARAALAKASRDVAVDGDSKKPAVDAAAKALAAAEKASASPGVGFTRLVASSKSPESNMEKPESRAKPFPATSTGRRSALAQWITHKDNPLAARVIVNHIWNRHFGQPLVPTVFDYGRKGTPPTHPELLDTLAVELMEHGWDLRYLHRLIVTSRAYQLDSSTLQPAEQQKDPENKSLWRFPSRRLESQVVRDALLVLANKLDTTRGGASIPVNDEASRRRSLYFVHSHNDHNRFLAQFDDAGVQECYRRSESIVPQQSLALIHGKLASETSETVRQLLDPAGTVPRDVFIRSAFKLMLARSPSPAELDLCISELAEDNSRARAGLVLALVNHHDFITVR